MRIQEKSIPCTVQLAIKVADMVGLKEKDELLRNVFVYLSKVDFRRSSTPELIGEIFSLLNVDVVPE